jgi:hypothetical protein
VFYNLTVFDCASVVPKVCYARALNITRCLEINQEVDPLKEDERGGVSPRLCDKLLPDPPIVGRFMSPHMISFSGMSGGLVIDWDLLFGSQST